MTDDERGHVEIGDDVGHGKGFAASCHAEQYLVAHAGFDAGHKRINRLWLIAGRVEIGFEGKFHAY